MLSLSRLVALTIAPSWLWQVATGLDFAPPFDTGLYSQHVELRGGEQVLYWQIDSAADAIEFAVAAQTDGWVAVGFNALRGMAGADIVLGRDKHGDGTISVTDMHATSFATPLLDSQSDIVVRASGRSGGVTWFAFARPLVTCDSEDFQFNDLAEEFSLLAAVGTSDELQQHLVEGREASRLRLRGVPLEDADASEEVRTTEIIAPDVLVEQAAGSFACSLHELPHDVDYHLIRYKVLFGSSAYVADVGGGIFHHIDMFACSSKPPGNVGSLVSCDVGMGYCRDMLLSGGYSGDGQSMPPNTGFLVNSENRYVLISRHFYNIQMKPNVVDSGTGYRIWYTPNLRANSMGRLSIIQGHLDVPVGATDFDVVGYCPSKCTRELWPQEGITVTRVSFHMHSAGRRQYLQVIRDGKELQELARVEPFDWSGATIDVNYRLLPGDTLRMHCVYDNTQGVSLQWGDARLDEMCVVNIEYYPKTELLSCADFAKGQTDMWAPDAGLVGMCNTYCQSGQSCGAGGVCEQYNWPGDCDQCACPLCDNAYSEPRVYCTKPGDATISVFDHPVLCPGCLDDKTSAAEPYQPAACVPGSVGEGAGPPGGATTTGDGDGNVASTDSTSDGVAATTFIDDVGVLSRAALTSTFGRGVILFFIATLSSMEVRIR